MIEMNNERAPTVRTEHHHFESKSCCLIWARISLKSTVSTNKTKACCFPRLHSLVGERLFHKNSTLSVFWLHARHHQEYL